MADNLQTKSFNFDNKGVVLKRDPAQLTPGEYQNLRNMTSIQEGNLVTRMGCQQLGTAVNVITRIQKVAISNVFAYRYLLVADNNLYRTPDYSAITQVAAGVTGNADLFRKRMSAVAYDSGDAAALILALVASPNKMLKDFPTQPLSTLQSWGVLPAAGVCLAVIAGAVSGGPDTSPAGATPYDYVFCFRNPSTGNQGNPSQFMFPTAPPGVAGTAYVANSVAVSPVNHSVTVTVWGTNDPQIPSGTANTIAIYRRGGTFSDGLFRFIGYATNPGMSGSFPASTTFTDSNSDYDLRLANILEFDNDPPVPSGLPTPIFGRCNGTPGLGWGYVNTVTNLSPLTPGTLVHFATGLVSENVVVQALNGTTAMAVYLLYQHANNEGFEIDTITGQPAHLSYNYGDSVFIAGDPNNPHVLYKSKSGLPESFPIAEASGNVNAVNVGTPDKPIMAITEMNGEIICFTPTDIFVVQLWNGQMQTPYRSQARRGLFAPFAWCRVDNELWFLAYDGIYSWNGGVAIKRSEAIDPLFKGETVNGMLPIDLRNVNTDFLNSINFAYDQNEVVITYPVIGSTVGTAVLRYNTIYNRWLPGDENSPNGITALLSEDDVGDFIIAAGAEIAKDRQVGTNGTTDYFTGSAGTNGNPINWRARSGFFTFDAPTLQKMFSDITLEAILPPGAGAMTVNVYYDFSATVGDTFTIASSALGRARYNLLTNIVAGASQGKEAYAIAFEFLGSTPVSITLCSLSFSFYTIAEVTTGRTGDWQDFGYPWDKRLYSLWVEYETTSEPVTLNLDVMSGLAANPVTTLGVQQFVLPVGGRNKITFAVQDLVVGKKFRLRPNKTTGQNVFFQLIDWGVQKEDEPSDTIDQTPWNFFDYPYDKQAKNLSMRVDTGGINTQVTVMTENGGIAIFTVNTSFAKEPVVLPFNADLIGKCFRLVIVPGANGKFKLWEWNIDHIKDPADVVLLTEWKDFGWPCEKIGRNLILTVDTGGVPATIVVQADGVTKTMPSVTTTYQDRQRILALPSDLIGKRWRLLPSPGPGGKLKLWDWNIDFVKEPCQITHWDSYELTFGYDGYKFVKQIWLQYHSLSQVTYSLFVDQDFLLDQQILPAAFIRSVARFYLPPNNGVVLNKSKIYRIQLDSVAPGFQFYAGASRVEWMPVGADQRQAYQQYVLGEEDPGEA